SGQSSCRIARLSHTPERFTCALAEVDNKHRDTKAQRHRESRQTKLFDAGFLCVSVPLCLCVLFIALVIVYLEILKLDESIGADEHRAGRRDAVGIAEAAVGIHEAVCTNAMNLGRSRSGTAVRCGEQDEI